MNFQTFSDVEKHLEKLGLFHMDFGLQRMVTALSAFPAPSCPVVQFVGTNGKGSTASFLASLIEQHGLRVGLFTSPHLVHVRERIRINGNCLSESTWLELAARVYAAMPGLTYFEFVTVLAVQGFVDACVDCIILEAGLGGQYDATTAVPAELVCFTPIAMDHMQVLGSDLLSITADKAGAIRNGAMVMSAPQSPEALDCLRRVAREQGSQFREAPVRPEAGASSTSPVLGLQGPHQQINAALALEAWRFLAQKYRWQTRAEAECAGLAQAFVPGRFQTIPATQAHPAFLLDGAHNPHGFLGLVAALESAGIHPCALIFTCMADKDEAALLPLVKVLAGQRGIPILVPGIPGNARASNADELAAKLGGNSMAYLDLEQAIAAAVALKPREADGPLLICGSLYLLGEFYRQYPHYLEQKPHE